MGMFSLFPNFPSIPPTETALQRRNQYPIILVHGLAGFGRNEMGGFKYWGGLYDIESDLRSRGFNTCTAAVGPFSSNWDRACELFAQIKGGTVDYGAAHSEKYGHDRFGRTYQGFFPEWGTPDPDTGEIRKIHLIGHSMGGQTIRTLAQLLSQGAPLEQKAVSDSSPLFTGGKSWISGIMSVSTPHDGSSLAYATNAALPFFQQQLACTAAATGILPSPVYDLKLDHWGLKWHTSDNLFTYLERIQRSHFWISSHDTAAWDLSPEGACELNQWVHAQPDVYYFSWSTAATWKEPLTGYHLPSASMGPLWSGYGLVMGIYTQKSGPHAVPVTEDWRQNDGWVNTISMDGPKIGSSDRILPFTNPIHPGVWHHMGLLNDWDHTDIVGIGNCWPVSGWYHAQADLLGSLPSSGQITA